MTVSTTRLLPVRGPGLTRVAGRGLLYVLAVAFGALFMVPYLWAVVTSLKTPLEVTQIPPAWLPVVPQWQNYLTVINVTPFLTFLLNSVILTGFNVVGGVLSSAVVAYGFARFRFRGRDVLFLILLSGLMLPREVTIIPQYMMFNSIGWLDTYWPLIVPHWLAGSPFGVFLLRQFFMTIPTDFDDAARIDGASSFQIFWRIILPLSSPALAALAIFGFLASWNSFWEPLIYLNSQDKLPLAVGLNWFIGGAAGTGNLPKTHLLLAFAVMMTAPVIAVFFFGQRYFIKGVVLGGLK